MIYGPFLFLFMSSGNGFLCATRAFDFNTCWLTHRFMPGKMLAGFLHQFF